MLKDNESRLGMIIREDLHLEVKRHCVDTGESVRDFVERALQNQLNQDKKKRKK